MCLFKGLVFTSLLLVAAGTEEVEDPVSILSVRGKEKLKQQVRDLEEKLQQVIDVNTDLEKTVQNLENVNTDLKERMQKLENVNTDLEGDVQQLVNVNTALNAKVDSLTGAVRNNMKQVAFSARIGRNIPISEKGKIIKFRGVRTNIGNAYNSNTGIFRCPVSGLYLFSCSILGTAPGFVTITINKNGTPLARPQTGRSVAGHGSGSDTVVVRAKVGDTIAMKISDGNSRFLNHMSRCTLVLLKTD